MAYYINLVIPHEFSAEKLAEVDKMMGEPNGVGKDKKGRIGLSYIEASRNVANEIKDKLRNRNLEAWVSNRPVF